MRSKIHSLLLFFFLLLLTKELDAQSVQASIGQGSTASSAVAFYIQSPTAVSGALTNFHASFAIPATAVTQPFTPILTLNNTGLGGVNLIQTTAIVNGTLHYIYTYILTGTNVGFSLPANTLTKVLEVRFDGCTGGCATEIKAVALNDDTHPQHYFYMSVGGIEQMNFTAPFFDNGAETNPPMNLGTGCSSGYGCGSFVGAAAVSLPIELLTFKPYTDKCDLSLYWETATEKNFGYFQIEASKDGGNFKAIEQVKPASPSSSTLQVYKYPVPSNYHGYYFRLKSVDLDGAYDYSKIVYTQAPCDKQYSAQLYPNPNVIENITVEINSAENEDQIQLIVLDAVGKHLQTQQVDIQAGVNKITVDTQALPSGTYFIKIVGITKLSAPLKFIKSTF